MRHYQKTNISTIIKGKNGMIAISDEENKTKEFINIFRCFQLVATLFRNVPSSIRVTF